MEKFARCELRLYRMEILSDLRVGAGEGSEELPATDLLQKKQHRFIRNAEGKLEELPEPVPYIPGESLYGAIRACIESFHRNTNLNDCYNNASDTKKEEIKAKFEALYSNEKFDPAKTYKIYKEVCNPLDEKDKCESLDEKDGKKSTKKDFLKSIDREIPCPVCKVYGYGGAGGHIGRLSITPAYPAKSILEKNILQDHTNISIDRITGTAAEGNLRDSETIIPGSYLYFFVKFNNVEADVIKNMFEPAIEYLSSVGSIGSGKTKGRGMINIEQVFVLELNQKLFKENDEFQKIKDYKNVEAFKESDKLPYYKLATDLPYYQRGEIYTCLFPPKYMYLSLDKEITGVTVLYPADAKGHKKGSGT